MTPEDLTAIGITHPSHRRKIKLKLENYVLGIDLRTKFRINATIFADLWRTSLYAKLSQTCLDLKKK
ncbi:unnamed protein product [Didymodactylos carnosus]|uniref:SAM domain-containing protein n=1 Tax=Didymodactylos carnosus TaxID=1234261 RepID=A0A8S2YQ75_9BILA|nr:unnamed protein product [Didymodactylos carnosus]